MSEIFARLRQVFGRLPETPLSPELEAARTRASAINGQVRSLNEELRQRLEEAVDRREAVNRALSALTPER